MGIKLRCIKAVGLDFKEGNLYEVSNNIIKGYEFNDIDWFNRVMCSKFDVVEDENKNFRIEDKILNIINNNNVFGYTYTKNEDKHELTIVFETKPTWSEWTDAEHKSYSYRRKGKTVQVRSNITGYKACANCSPEDEFDLEKGILICLLRIKLKEVIG